MPIKFEDDTPERTKKLAHKFVIKPSKEAIAFCDQWLYRVNVIQKGKLTLSDIDKVLTI